MKHCRRGFSLLEVLVALLIITVVWAALSSILFKNFSRVAGGDGQDQLLDLAHMKLMEKIEEGYPTEEIAMSNWEEFVSVNNEDMPIHPRFRWRFMVEEYKKPDWAEGSDRDEEQRYEAGVKDPYRLVVIEVQEFENVEPFDEYLTIGEPFRISRIMKPEAANSAGHQQGEGEGETTEPSTGDGS